MASIQKQYNVNRPQLGDKVAKVVVIGEPECGKTRFIRQYYDHHFPGEIYYHNGVSEYNCVLGDNDQERSVSIFEISAYPDYSPGQRKPYYEQADIFVFMYAIDDPTSFQRLSEKWLMETIDIIEARALSVVFVGNKNDLRDDQEVIECLAAQNQSLVTMEQSREILNLLTGQASIIPCSANDVHQVELAFKTIFGLILLTEQD